MLHQQLCVGHKALWVDRGKALVVRAILCSAFHPPNSSLRLRSVRQLCNCTAATAHLRTDQALAMCLVLVLVPSLGLVAII